MEVFGPNWSPKECNVAEGYFSEGFFNLENVNKHVTKAWKDALLDPYPKIEALTKSVYSA